MTRDQIAALNLPHVIRTVQEGLTHKDPAIRSATRKARDSKWLDLLPPTAGRGGGRLPKTREEIAAMDLRGRYTTRHDARQDHRNIVKRCEDEGWFDLLPEEGNKGPTMAERLRVDYCDGTDHLCNGALTRYVWQRTDPNPDAQAMANAWWKWLPGTLREVLEYALQCVETQTPAAVRTSEVMGHVLQIQLDDPDRFDKAIPAALRARLSAHGLTPQTWNLVPSAQTLGPLIAARDARLEELSRAAELRWAEEEAKRKAHSAQRTAQSAQFPRIF